MGQVVELTDHTHEGHLIGALEDVLALTRQRKMRSMAAIIIDDEGTAQSIWWSTTGNGLELLGLTQLLMQNIRQEME